MRIHNTTFQLAALSLTTPLFLMSPVWANTCSKAEIDNYIQRLADRDQAALNSLANCGDIAIPSLIEALSIPNTEIREGALIVLSKNGENAIAPLIQALDTDNGDARDAASDALARIGSDAIPQLLVALKSENENILFGVTRAMYQFGESAEPTLPDLIRILGNRELNVHIRRHTANALGSISSEQAVPILIEVLQDKNENLWVRRSSAAALGAIGSPDGIPVLVETLQDPIATVRAHAVGALGNFGSEAAIALPTLIEMLQEEDNEVRFRVAGALGKIGVEARVAVPALINILEDPDASIRNSASTSLNQIVEALYDEANTPEQLDEATEIALQIREALSGSGEFEDTLLRLDRTIEALADRRKTLLLQSATQFVLVSRNVWLAHAGFWFALLFLYPKSSQVQAIFFWNPWIRKIMGLGYVGVLLTWVPLLRQRLFSPFKDSLLADANLENFAPETYFKDSKIKRQDTDDAISQQDFLKTRGQKVLVGNSGLGKSMMLRYLCQQSQRIMVYLPAIKCIDGVIEAIQRKLHGEEIKDPTFLQNLIYSGAIDICIDGLNEVSAETRVKIVEFTENYFKGNIILATQPMEWIPPATATLYELESLEPTQIQAFLLSRKSLIPDYAPVRDDTYEHACSRYLEQVFQAGRTPEETEMIQRILSNPMDLTVVASMIAAGQQPDISRLQEQQYAVMAADYDERHIEGKFPLDLFSEAVYQMRLQDQMAIPADFLEELQCLERHKMVVSRQSQDTDSKPIKEWYFRHDKIMEFFILKAFLSSPERQEQHLGDPRFRGVYFLLASFLELQDAIALREMLIQYAADTKDHTVSDTFIQLLRSRKTEKTQVVT